MFFNHLLPKFIMAGAIAGTSILDVSINRKEDEDGKGIEACNIDCK